MSDNVYHPEYIRPGYDTPPTPFVEKPAPDESWSPDFHDDALPSSPGFISDFVYHTRGFETPTLSCIWTALFILASALKREAWMRWAPNGLFPNQYVIIIGPAGIVKKTTAVSVVGLPILRKFRNFIKNKNMYAMKSICVVKDKTTPEALIDGLLPENKDGQDTYLLDEDGNNILDETGKAVRYRRTSEAAIVVSELSSMLGKASYSDTMIPLLLDLYDCHEDWDWKTMKRGKQTLRNLHTTLLAGTTVEGMRSSIPPSATGDGFMSRTIMVYVPDTKRCYRRPFIPKNAPSQEELAKRLAWIATNRVGEFELTPEADYYMDGWYRTYKEYQRANPDVAAAMSRMDINVYKTALLMRAQRYDDDQPFITLQDIKDATRLLDITYASFHFLRSQISPDDLISWSARISEYLSKRKGRIKRIYIMQRTHLTSELAVLVFEELLQKGFIKAYYDGKEIQHATTRTQEEYEWVGGEVQKAERKGGRPSGPSGKRAEGPRRPRGRPRSIDPEALRDDTSDGGGFGGLTHGPETLDQREGLERQVRPEGGDGADAGASAQTAPGKPRGPRQVAGGASRGRPAGRKPEGRGEEDRVQRRSSKDVHVPGAKGKKARPERAARPPKDAPSAEDEGRDAADRSA